MFLGLFLVFGAVGGMDIQLFASKAVFASQIVIAVIGLILMYFGAKKISQQ
jgi:uncharacterized membrane protein